MITKGLLAVLLVASAVSAGALSLSRTSVSTVVEISADNAISTSIDNSAENAISTIMQEDCGWDPACWEASIKADLNTAVTDVDEKAKKLASYAVTVEKTIGALEKMGNCIKTLAKNDEASMITGVQKLGDAVEADNLINYTKVTYLDPMLVQAKVDLEHVMTVLKNDLLLPQVPPPPPLVVAGRVDPSALDSIPKKAIGMLRRIGSKNPTLMCLLNASVVVGKDMEAIIAPIAKLIMPVVQDEFDKLVNGSEALVSKLLGMLQEELGAEIHKLFPKTEKLDKVVGNGMKTMCYNKTSELLAYLKEPHTVPEGFCFSGNATIKQDLTQALTFVITDVLDFVLGKFKNEMNKHVFVPIMGKILKLVHTATAALWQLLDGLCGLIPEAGGPICAAISVPISHLSGMLNTELTKSWMVGLVNELFDWIEEKVDGWAATAAGDIVNATASALQPLATKITGVAAELKPAEQKFMAIVHLLEPFVDFAFETIFPNIHDAIETCEEDIITLGSAVQDLLCNKTDELANLTISN